ncbi:RagB/SusD family nutrient uptake outer membrane protein [Flagellimonas sp.]|uniref:RagB/SusD family nutrient uptake outer membrane protein n=1 Tax=Flagellimonas sp. TaxID=2058762 RepID=UPI003B501F6F
MKYYSIKKSRPRIVTYVGSLILGLMVLSSCSEDILDQQPLSDISDENVFNDDVLLEAYVNDVYNVLRFYQFGAFFTDGSTDDAVNLDPDGSNFTRYNRGETTADNGEGFTRNAWRENYLQIRKANLYFSRIENSTASPEVVDRLTAEMRFLRAWAYFDLISFYGGVPLITEVIELGSESFDTVRTPYEEVVDFIVNELDLAIPELPIEAFNSDTGRATRGAAMGLKSRVLLYAASELHNPSGDVSKWQAAANAAKEVIDLPEYSIDPDYSNLYNTERSREVILARGYTQENPQFVLFGWFFNVDRYFLPPNYFGDVDTRFFAPLQSLVDAYETLDGSPVDPQDPYANRDPRLDMTLIHHNSELPVNGTDTPIEYHLDQSDPSNSALAGPASVANGGTASHYNVLKQTDISKAPLNLFGATAEILTPWIYMRKSEFYLNYAEAQIELGNFGEARTAINNVRARANVGMPPVTESGDALRQRYRNERRVELAFENHRWYDIVRWQIGEDVLAQPALGVTITRDSSVNPPVDTFSYGDRVIDDLRIWDPKMSFLPIPRSEIEASPSLTQNPGYN